MNSFTTTDGRKLTKGEWFEDTRRTGSRKRTLQVLAIEERSADAQGNPRARVTCAKYMPGDDLNFSAIYTTDIDAHALLGDGFARIQGPR